MNDLLKLLPAFLLGIVLGVFFFGGLWLTVRNCMASKWVAPCFLGSLLLRTAVVLAGFYFVLGKNWQNLLAGLLGFVIARVVVTRLLRSAPPDTQLPRKEHHAS